MNIAKTLLIAAPLLMLPQLANAAGVCHVDPTGSFGMPFSDIDMALTVGGCDAPGSVIEVYCPPSGCGHPSVTISGLHDIHIVSAELFGHGAVSIVNSYSPNAVSIDTSHGIVFRGFDAFIANDRAIEIVDSQVSVFGLQGAGRYSHTQGTTGVYVEGLSDVDLHWVGFAGSQTGLEIVGGTSAMGPKVFTEGGAFLDNGTAVDISGTNGPRFDLRTDIGATLHNYVMGNDQGVLASGDAKVEIDHTIFAGNLRLGPGSPAFPNLLEVADSSTMILRNALIYDNDAKPNPGIQLPWSAWSSATACGGSACTNTNGRILQHTSSEFVNIVASTIIDNQTDLVFNLDASGSGRLHVDHTIMAHNWGKVYSMSSFWPGCPPATSFGSFFWDNRVDADPVSCAPPVGTWDPAPISAGFTPDTLGGYPNLPAPFTDLYWVTAYEPVPAPMPPNLFMGPPWAVDGGAPDTGDLDVGYHNPL